MSTCYLLHSQPASVQRVSPHTHLMSGGSTNANGLLLLHQAFQAYLDVISQDTDASKAQLQQLQAEWQSKGMCGLNSLNLLSQHRQQIMWEAMIPEQFCRFYKFVFSICREPGRRHVLVSTAIQAWRLLLTARFRLLEAWCDFISKSTVQVVTEDMWRQVLDFCRTIHEDLSNYDPSSAWAVILDEFVEYLRQQHPSISARRTLSAETDASGCSQSQDSIVAVPPRCGSKRRNLDLDTVAQQLSNIPLDTSSSDSEMNPSFTPKRACVAAPGSNYPQPQAVPPTYCASQSFTASMPPAHQQFQYQGSGPPSSQRRKVTSIRRSGMSELIKSTVADALGLNSENE